MTHNYAVFEQVWARKHFWNKKTIVLRNEIIDGFTDPYDADVMREQIEKENPGFDFITDEKEEEDEEDRY